VMDTLVVPIPRRESERVEIVEYTDPYSVWCWGCEPALRRLAYRYSDAISIRYVMGGLFEDFTPMREHWSRMAGGQWKEAVQTFLAAVAGQHGMPIHVEGMMASMDDFRSTWPACIAVCAAALQGKEAEASYLRALREAELIEGRDIGRREVQLSVAEAAGLDAPDVAAALDDGSALVAFRKDLTECQLRGVSGFPSFDIGVGPASIRLEGYRSWEAMEEELLAIAPALTPRDTPPTGPGVLDVLRTFGRSATREVAGVLSLTDDDAEILLEELEADGRVRRLAFGPAVLWGLAERE